MLSKFVKAHSSISNSPYASQGKENTTHPHYIKGNKKKREKRASQKEKIEMFLPPTSPMYVRSSGSLSSYTMGVFSLRVGKGLMEFSNWICVIESNHRLSAAAHSNCCPFVHVGSAHARELERGAPAKSGTHNDASYRIKHAELSMRM